MDSNKNTVEEDKIEDLENLEEITDVDENEENHDSCAGSDVDLPACDGGGAA